MAQENLVKMKCTVCNEVNHYTTRNKKLIKEKLELKKYCKFCRKNTPHKETK
jgi:large subunit ribosomal protein L33